MGVATQLTLYYVTTFNTQLRYLMNVALSRRRLLQRFGGSTAAAEGAVEEEPGYALAREKGGVARMALLAARHLPGGSSPSSSVKTGPCFTTRKQIQFERCLQEFICQAAAHPAA